MNRRDFLLVTGSTLLFPSLAMADNRTKGEYQEMAATFIIAGSFKIAFDHVYDECPTFINPKDGSGNGAIIEYSFTHDKELEDRYGWYGTIKIDPKWGNKHRRLDDLHPHSHDWSTALDIEKGKFHGDPSVITGRVSDVFRYNYFPEMVVNEEKTNRLFKIFETGELQ